MIEIRSLCVGYATPVGPFSVLEQVSLAIKPGDIYAVIGPSGCGKSTLLHTLSGINPQYEGDILIDGRPLSPHNHRIGLVLQNYGLLPWKTVYENSLLGLHIKDDPVDKDRQYIAYILGKLGIYELKDRYPNRLSGGQKQRAAIARSFILKPQILLMDEPFSALDAITREETQDLFLSLWQENKVSTLFVTHSIEEAVLIGKKIAIMSPSPGCIVEVLDNPLFGNDRLRLEKDYYQYCMDIRRLVREKWIK